MGGGAEIAHSCPGGLLLASISLIGAGCICPPMQLDRESWEPEGRYKIKAIRGEGGRLDVTDYVCPQCHKLIYFSIRDSRHCPHCGGAVFGAQNKKLADRQYRGMPYAALDAMRYTGPKRPKAHK